jgi:integrase
MRAVTSIDVEEIRDRLDARIHRGEIAWQTAFNAWTCLRMMFRDAREAKRRDIRVRTDNPTNDVAPPDRGTERAKQYLYPSEFLQLVSCEEVPLGWRRAFTLATYLLLRMGELAVLGWDDLDIERRTVHVHRAMRRRSNEEKETKSGSKRRFLIEPALVPLLKQMHHGCGGTGRVSQVLPWGKHFRHFAAIGLREYLALAGVRRAELFTDDATRKWITFHDLRATGITWMAVRGDDPLKIKQRAGHSHLVTTERYIRIAEELREGFGTVFPELPRSLLL